MKKTPLYILEARKKVNHKRNSTTHVIGVFTAPKLARSWIQENSPKWWGKQSSKRRFWALLYIGELNTAEHMWLHAFYDHDGNEIDTEDVFK